MDLDNGLAPLVPALDHFYEFARLDVLKPDLLEIRSPVDRRVKRHRQGIPRHYKTDASII